MNRYEPFYLPLFPLSLFFTSILQLHFCSTHSYQFSPRKEIARSLLRINSFQQITLTLIRILNCIPLKTFNFKRCWNHHRNGDTLFPFGSLFWLVLASLASSEAIILDQCFSTSAYNFARKGRKRGREETKTRVGEEREKKDRIRGIVEIIYIGFRNGKRDICLAFIIKFRPDVSIHAGKRVTGLSRAGQKTQNNKRSWGNECRYHC